MGEPGADKPKFAPLAAAERGPEPGRLPARRWRLPRRLRGGRCVGRSEDRGEGTKSAGMGSTSAKLELIWTIESSAIASICASRAPAGTRSVG